MKLFDSFSPHLLPVGNGTNGNVHPQPSMDSLSCVSCLRDYQKNPGEEAGEISSTVDVPARNFFPLTPDPKGFLDAKELKKDASEVEEEEERCGGVSTELTLLYDPYKIKKKLTKSDLGHLSRFLIPRAGVKSHVLSYMSKERVERVESSEGDKVAVWDADTRSEHQLVFVHWISSKSYVLKGCWNKEFVQRKGLADGDEIGIYWDPIASRFVLSLLRKAN